MLEPFRKALVEVRFYPVSARLRLEEDSWTAGLSPADLVIAIHYFGFEFSSFPWQRICEKGAILLEDCGQALFKARTWPGSYGMVFSPRKFIGIPDGGVLAGGPASHSFGHPLEPAPPDWWSQALEASLLRRDFDLAGGENKWYALFQNVEATYPVGPFRASELSTFILEEGVDYRQVAEARRANYAALLVDLGEYAIFPALEEGCVPLGFPVTVPGPRREAILRFLYARQIYPPVHWRLRDAVPSQFAESHDLSERILTLIVDQRHDSSDMRRQKDCFLQAVRSA
jgi:dTDP-4-amino-4,6-dideoxygalactose transaminase